LRTQDTEKGTEVSETAWLAMVVVETIMVTVTIYRAGIYLGAGLVTEGGQGSGNRWALFVSAPAYKSIYREHNRCPVPRQGRKAAGEERLD
jgi:hypothetical protein